MALVFSYVDYPTLYKKACVSPPVQLPVCLIRFHAVLARESYHRHRVTYAGIEKTWTTKRRGD